ncbi:MAG: hypothetical protein JST82_10945 [Bacteroidetes bacterium]|nr:hypothetical protein [Bacteroidota bacterium]
MSNLFKSLWKFFWNNKQQNTTDITLQDYENELLQGTKSIIEGKTTHEVAYEKAWDARRFEIDNYWKRATYFWAFQIAAFAAYAAIINSEAYNSDPKKNPQILFIVICIGFITALAWALNNIGSKFWQRHWEKHIDMLEDKVTGPLYKIVYMHKTDATFSVSKINEIISRFFTVIWVVLAAKYVADNIYFTGTWRSIAWIEISSLIISIYFTGAMFMGYGRGHFGAADFSFKKRKVFK